MSNLAQDEKFETIARAQYQVTLEKQSARVAGFMVIQPSKQHAAAEGRKTALARAEAEYGALLATLTPEEYQPFLDYLASA